MGHGMQCIDCCSLSQVGDMTQFTSVTKSYKLLVLLRKVCKTNVSSILKDTYAYEQQVPGELLPPQQLR